MNLAKKTNGSTKGPRYRLMVYVLPGRPRHDIVRKLKQRRLETTNVSATVPRCRTKRQVGSRKKAHPSLKTCAAGSCSRRPTHTCSSESPLDPTQNGLLTALRPVQQPRVIHGRIRPTALRNVLHPCNAPDRHVANGELRARRFASKAELGGIDASRWLAHEPMRPQDRGLSA